MLQFTTKDIVKRARELADLENSSFITWSENMKLLDECYKKLYQESINVNDKYYLKRIELKDLVVGERREKEVSYYLPSDFYQLSGISVKNSGRQILKKAKTEDSSSARYDIINNSLVLYGGSASLPLEIAYYPVPKTLTLKNEKISIKIDGKVLDTNGNTVLSLNDGDAIITDVNTGSAKTIDVSSISGNIITGLLGVKKFFVITETFNAYLCDIKTGTIESKNVFMGKKDGVLYYADIGWNDTGAESITISNEYSKEIVTFALNVNPVLFFTLDDELNTYWFVNDEYFRIIKRDNDGNITEVVKVDNLDITGGYEQTKLQIIKGHLFYLNGSVFCDDVKLLSQEDYSEFYGFNKMDYDTGYGFTVGTIYDETEVHSCFTDTELDFPNNLYFSYLAYLLAIAYKQKQNADATMLIQRASDEYAQFLTSISRDVAENNRIQNVYGGGTFYYG